VRPLVVPIACAFGAAAVCLAAAQATPSQQAPPQPAPPIFRAGIDVITMDVSVLDKDRRPVRGLTEADFTVLDKGVPQPIAGFAAIDLPDRVVDGAPWTRDIAPDVTSNALDTRRLIMIVLDDAMTGWDYGASKSARDIAIRVIDKMGPADLAAVAFTYLGRQQTFTSDRAQLRKALDTYVPKNSASAGPPLACALKTDVGGCSTDLLRHIGDALISAPAGRKMMIYISPNGFPLMSTENPNLFSQMTPFTEMLNTLQRANITVYSFDPNGLQRATLTADTDSLRVASNATGGRTIANTNVPERLVHDVFVENDSYYLIGIRPLEPKHDNRFRTLTVRVNRPDTMVRTRTGYFDTKLEKPSKKPPPSPIDQAIARGMPAGDLPLRLATAAFAVPGRDTADLAVIVGLDEPRDRVAAGTTKRRVSVIATAFDDGWRSKGAQTQTIELTLAPESTSDLRYEVISRLPLKAGRYEIRFAAEAGGRAGSVFVDLDVPNFAKTPLSMSGLVLERSPRTKVAPANALANLIPIVPTADRAFARADRVVAFVRLYQGGKGALKPATLRARIVGTHDEAVFDEQRTFAPEQFARARAADYQLPLPLARLLPGEYLLSVETTLDKAQDRRDIRFTVR